MGLESGRSERPKDPAILAQVTLAQLASGSGDRHQAMNEWLAGGKDSLAAHFRKYVEEHPDENLNADDEAAMHELLEKIRTYH